MSFFFLSRNWCFRNYYVVKRFGLFSRLLAGNHVYTSYINIFGRRVLDHYLLITNPVRRYRPTHYSSSSRRYKLLLLTDNAPRTHVILRRESGGGGGGSDDRVSAHAQLTAQYKLYGSNIKSLDFYIFNPLKQHTSAFVRVRMAMRT